MRYNPPHPPPHTHTIINTIVIVMIVLIGPTLSFEYFCRKTIKFQKKTENSPTLACDNQAYETNKN